MNDQRQYNNYQYISFFYLHECKHLLIVVASIRYPPHKKQSKLLFILAKQTLEVDLHKSPVIRWREELGSEPHCSTSTAAPIAGTSSLRPPATNALGNAAGIKLYGDVACELHTGEVNKLSVNVVAEPQVVGHTAANDLETGRRVWSLHEYNVALPL